MIVVDDHLLLGVVRGRVFREIVSQSPYATTLGWHYRASRAIITGTGSGTMSRTIRNLPEQQQAEIRSLISNLPPMITTVDPRNIVPIMTTLSTFGPANLLALEAVATALVLDAALAITTPSPILERVAKVAGVEINLVSLRRPSG